MASQEVAKIVRARDLQLANGGGCQFPRYGEQVGLKLCGPNKQLVTHAIIPPTWTIIQHPDSSYFQQLLTANREINPQEKTRLLKIIGELRNNPDAASRYEEIFFNILVLKQILNNPDNYILLCPIHHQLIYSRLRELATVGNRINWGLFAQLSLGFALNGVRYWNWQYEDWFLDRAKKNSIQSRQKELSTSQARQDHQDRLF